MTKRFTLLLLMMASGLALGAPLSVTAQSGYPIELVSAASAGGVGSGHSQDSAISNSGRYVAFSSFASNLVASDSNNRADIFVRDRDTGTTTRVSVATDGAQSNGDAFTADISGDGRFVVFTSDASTLVTGDSNAFSDVFVSDRDTDDDDIFDETDAVATLRVSVASDGTQAFGGHSTQGRISGNGRFIVFVSRAANLVTGDTNNRDDVFVHDRDSDIDGIFDEAGEIATTRVSVASGGTQANGDSDLPTLSVSGRFVVFNSEANNLVTGDTNNRIDLFLHDRQTATTERVSIATGGVQANNDTLHGVASSNGRYVAFGSQASNLIANDTNIWPDVFLRDRVNGTTTLISASAGGVQGNDTSFFPIFSDDDEIIAFHSAATNLVPGDTNAQVDVFVRKRVTGDIRRVTGLPNGTQGNGASGTQGLSADGRTMVFISYASNFVANDNNGASDVFVVSGYFADPPTAAPRRQYFTTATPMLTWNRISWATRYRIEIDTTAIFAAPLVYFFTTTTPDALSHIVTTPLEDGLYYWRVRALSGNSAGAWSATESFVVNAP